MLLLAGAVPIDDLPLVVGEARVEDGFITTNGYKIPCTQGTGVMVSAALAVTEYLKLPPPHIVLAGDIGRGKGSRVIYQYLIDKAPELSAKVLTLHYLFPDMALMRKLCGALEEHAQATTVVADAAAMYVAKAAGLAPKFDIFTPDATELAFLADPEATHPAYIAKHLFDTDMSQAPEMIKAAYAQNSAARYLLVKGNVDYVAKAGEIVATISEPDVPELEPIGGTGDTITGLVSALAYAGLGLDEAAVVAAKVNRRAGLVAEVTPATKAWQIVEKFPSVLKECLAA